MSTKPASPPHARTHNNLLEPHSLPSSPRGHSRSRSRGHARLHSRNLSVFFPRPGAAPPPHSTIEEDDDSQEISYPPVLPAGRSTLPTPLNANFSFGSRPPGSVLPSSAPSGLGSKRKGHHHKHSLSHNFFSFLDPGALSNPKAEFDTNDESNLHTQPALIPVSPWSQTFQTATKPDIAPRYESESVQSLPDPTGSVFATPVSIVQFLLGACLWVSGQQSGSLAATGLGYWVVFDAFGVALDGAVPRFLHASSPSRFYGNARVVGVFAFAQACYLLFASVYVCKEAVEHLLLSAGEGHHHHHGDENQQITGIPFPAWLTTCSVLTLSFTAFAFKNHARLVQYTDNYLPTPRQFLRALLSAHPFDSEHAYPPPTGPISSTFRNPYVLAPVLFAASLVAVVLGVAPAHHRVADLCLAGVEAFATFQLAYRACVVLGSVLLQTAPERGLRTGRMEAFLRLMRELERHPQITHLPAPHVWQLAPAAPGEGRLVVSLVVHVRGVLADEDVLGLVRWVSERVEGALGGGRARRYATRRGNGDARREEEGDVEVTVGIVRD